MEADTLSSAEEDGGVNTRAPAGLTAAASKATARAGGKASKGKVPRGYAPPELYAHLQNTPDHLARGLKSECLASV
jgi:hypothetical protein